MADILWSQDFFAKGELSPLMYSRVTLNAYYQGLKRAKNVLCLPQGSAGKRFGTKYQATLVETNYLQLYFKPFQYLNECCYLLAFYNDKIDIYLEGEVVAQVTGTGIKADEVGLINHTVLDNRFRVTTGIYRPKDLTRAAGSPNAITAFTSSTLTLTTPLTTGFFVPVQFTTAGTLPATSPQIHINKTYFIRMITTTTFSIYSTAQDAAANINAYVISSAGTTSNVVVLNTWTFANVTFKNRPVFDFNGGYDTSAFTPAATTGYSVNITRTSGTYNLPTDLIGGAFIGNGGIARITNSNGTNIITVSILQAFNSTAAIPGTEVLIAEPAWSDLRLWPRKCSSFQNRAFFANTELLSNGLWGSVVNQFNDFNDLESDPANAISWYPTSDSVNFINFIVPYRSLTIHTNSGVYSTPLSVETAITPTNFSLALQDSTAADTIQPDGLDNQIIVISGNDAHSLLWDGFNNAYTSSIISIANEQLLRTPIDQTPYIDKVRGGSRYMFISNLDGTMAIYQTLISENVSGFTDAVLEQSYGNAYFRWLASNFDGRAWFVTEREIGTASAPTAISGFTANSFVAAYAFATDTFTACSFAGTTLPTTSPQIVVDHVYWAVGVDATHFKIYLTQEDAVAGDNPYAVSSAGTMATVTAYPLVTKLFIEQLDFDAQMDCVGYYDSSPTSVITGQTRFNGQEVLMQGDGYGFNDLVENGNIFFEAHGALRPISEAQYGFPIDVEIQPLPLSISGGSPKSSNLVDTKHIRFVTFLFADTIGGTITDGTNVTPIAMLPLLDVPFGSPPVPITGSFEMSLFGGWNDFTYNSFTINHREPFGMKLTGIFYKVEV